MGFDSTLTLVNKAGTNKSFETIRTTGAETERMNVATSLLTPETLLTRKSLFSRDGIDFLKHTTSVRRMFVNASGKKFPALVSLGFELPLEVTVVAADLIDMYAYIRNYYTTADPATNANGALIGKT